MKYLCRFNINFLFRVVALLIIVLFSKNGFAQIDNPNLDRDAYIKGYSSNPVLFSPLEVVTIDNYDNFFLGVDFGEGNIAENPNNPTWYFTPFNVNSTHYTLNGHDWLINNPSFTNTAGDPVTTYDSLGYLYYDNMGTITGSWCVVSTNGGVSWQTPVSANRGNDKNWIAADQTAGPYSNYVYGVMTPGNIVRSTNRGLSFSLMQTVTNNAPGMMVCVGPYGNVQGGAVYVVTHTGSTPPTTYTFYMSTNGGANFALMSAQSFNGYIGTYVNSRNSVQNMRTRPYPMIAADNSYGQHRGRLYLIYAMNNPFASGNHSNIYCRYSDNNGTTWSDTVIVNDDLNTHLYDQYHPAIWCDKETGKLFVNWMDTRDCPTGDSALIYASYSINGGQSFVTNRAVSNKKMKINCSTCPGAGTPRYQGDYNGFVSNSKVGMLSWTDFRAGSFGSYTAYFPDFGMRLEPAVDSINSGNGMVTLAASVPGVKQYSDTVIFTAAITPTPAAGTLNVSFPSGNKISSFPGFVPVRVTAAGSVTAGVYTLTVTGKGPNGTPVHVRTSTIIAGSMVTGIGNDELAAKEFTIFQNYPNPFNPITRIDYIIPFKSDVNIVVYDALGKSVTEYSLSKQEAGMHYVVFNAKNLSSGVYYYRISAGKFSNVKKMLLLK